MPGDQRLRDGGPWTGDETEVTGDGYLESWGHQQATAQLGPTADGVSRDHGSTPIAVSPRGGGGLIRNQEDNFR